MEQPAAPPVVEGASRKSAKRRKRAKGAGKKKLSRLVVAGAVAAGLGVLGLELWLKAYLIPSGAMYPTIQVGDRIFATRYAMFGTPPPRRGEVVVFQYPDPNPNNDPTEFVKRVIALPGDELRMEGSVPIINGFRVPRCSLGTIAAEHGELEIAVEYLEGAAYLVATDLARPSRSQGPFVVASGEFYVLGDNRDNSSDSRAWNGGDGAGVPFENLSRRASWVWWPSDGHVRDVNGAPRLAASLSKLQVALDACLAKAPGVAQSTPPRAAAR